MHFTVVTTSLYLQMLNYFAVFTNYFAKVCYHFTRSKYVNFVKYFVVYLVVGKGGISNRNRERPSLYHSSPTDWFRSTIAS